ncbi:aldo/keto reductase [Glaciibacter sp. 2TAF33]|uniref:aldo/keto reductase n=1 Tax=Glaciibacter sp. 2TAF33 TaxID=3233015 RepID=UPI003F8EA617
MTPPAMEYRHLGHSGLQVSRLCLGTMMFGGATDPATAQRIIGSAREAGINFIDTADVYNAGESEVVTGAAIRDDRDGWVLATKFGNPMGQGPNDRGQSRKWIIAAVESSLRRLGTDYIDILYLHRSFDDAALPEAVRALGDLIRQGKLRHFGVSNFSGWRLGLTCQLADEFGLDRPVASQPVYSVVERSAERELIPAAGHYGVGVVSYSPLARGVLTGKYQLGVSPDPASRVGRGDPRMLQTEFRRTRSWSPNGLRAMPRVREWIWRASRLAGSWQTLPSPR